MEIAPGVNAAEWRTLALDDPRHNDWVRAVDILELRVKGRYIDPVDLLIEADRETAPRERRFGFTVLAIDCLLVETLGAFLLGLRDTDGKSRATFCHFLMTRPSFMTAFGEKTVAQRFYADFRCGILHQAEIGGASRVWSVGPLLTVEASRLTVNRTKFHESLSFEFNGYLEELRRESEIEKRANFRAKMNFIAAAR